MQKASMRGLLVLGLVLLGCPRRSSGGGVSPPTAVASEGREEAGPIAPFEVRADSSDLVFFWFDERAAGHIVQRVADVPAARRELVRVDPSNPAQRPAGWVYVTDLRAPSPQGTFPVRAMRAETFAARLRAMAGLHEAPGTPVATSPSPPSPRVAQGGPAQGTLGPHGSSQPSAPGVILYGASWCSACHSAANWLRAHNIPFVEKDIEQDPAAQQEMMVKAQRAGIPTGSIPILDVRGRILVGFSPPDIERALAGG